MKQKFEFKVTGIAVLKGIQKQLAQQAVEDDTVYIDDAGKEFRLRKRVAHLSPPGTGNKVGVQITGLHKNRLERLRKYMKQTTGDEPTYHEAVLFAIDTACDTLGIK